FTSGRAVERPTAVIGRKRVRRKGCAGRLHAESTTVPPCRARRLSLRIDRHDECSPCRKDSVPRWFPEQTIAFDLRGHEISCPREEVGPRSSSWSPRHSLRRGTSAHPSWYERRRRLLWRAQDNFRWVRRLRHSTPVVYVDLRRRTCWKTR